MVIKSHDKLEDYRLQERLGYQVARLNRLIDNKLEAGLAVHGVTRLQWFVMTGVEIENRRSPSELAEFAGVSRPSISRTLKSMEKAGYVERNLIGGDGRTRAISLTDAGREKLTICWDIVRENEKRLVRKLSPQQFEALADSVAALMSGETAELLDP